MNKLPNERTGHNNQGVDVKDKTSGVKVVLEESSWRFFKYLSILYHQ